MMLFCFLEADLIKDLQFKRKNKHMLDSREPSAHSLTAVKLYICFHKLWGRNTDEKKWQRNLTLFSIREVSVLVKTFL